MECQLEGASFSAGVLGLCIRHRFDRLYIGGYHTYPSAVVDAGYTMEKAASISSLYLLIAVPGKMILGYIF